jgi:hypothetical protein
MMLRNGSGSCIYYFTEFETKVCFDLVTPLEQQGFICYHQVT